VTAGSGHTVHCPLGLVFGLRIDTGDGHDLIVNRLGGVGDGVSRFVTINAGAGNDTVIDDSSNANLDGGPGNDALTPGFGRDVVVGGTGVDGANYSDHNVPVTVKLDGLGFDGANQEFDDVTNDVENLSGTFHGDVLIGNASNNWLYGGGGNDILRGDGGNDLIQGGAGNDTVDGGLGTDTATYIDHGGNVRVTLRSGLCAGHINLECDSVLLGTVENVIGGSGSDQLYGDDGPNVLLGGSGNDELVGFGGNDTLIGEGGPSDRASGGLGVDSCQAEFVSLSCP
jgi:Ca2+-binding RTX toxin-like protein